MSVDPITATTTLIQIDSTDPIVSVTAVVQAITTVVLVWITYRQMKHARESVESVDRSMKADFLPILMLGLSTFNSNDTTLNIELSNCGKGVAIRPRVLFPGQDDIVINSISPEESGNATINYQLNYILNKVSERERKIIIEYHDVFGRKVVTEANLVSMKLGTANDIDGVGWETWNPIIP